jgi:hypothetical protein
LARHKREYFHFFFFQNQLTGNLHIFIKIHHVSVKPLTYEILLIKMQLHTAKKFSSFGGKMALHVLLSIYSNNSHVGWFVGSSILISDTKVSKERIHIKKIIVSKIAQWP